MLEVAGGGEGLDRSGTDTQCFAYDYLRRLTEAWTQDEKACAETPAGNLIAGPAPYWQAYGAAPAAVATYANAGLSEIFVLTVVRAVSPHPFTPYQNAAQLGLAKPAREVVPVGEVACLVHNRPTAVGKRPGPETVTVESCQRTGEGLTVQIRSVTGDIHSSPERIAALVGKAWSGLS
ncbi:hypothetical protein [Streptomyces sp. NPDC101150]|uniref:hypothetical protein n=1 Tax=Streptomyces sp. NPDC101150 TaxID=3366114 RepID=UPI00380303F3